MGKIKELTKQMWNVPNMFTMLRVFCVPVFLVLMFLYRFADMGTAYLYASFGVFAFAAATDLFDGAVARKFNCVTELGKVLDPFADKIMHVCVVLGLTIIGNIHWAFIVLIVLKELTMVIGGGYLVKHGVIVFANMMGKVASATLSAGVLLAFFVDLHVVVKYVDIAVLSLAVVFTYIALVNYGIPALRQFKQIKKAEREGKPVENVMTEKKSDEKKAEDTDK